MLRENRDPAALCRAAVTAAGSGTGRFCLWLELYGFADAAAPRNALTHIVRCKKILFLSIAGPGPGINDLWREEAACGERIV